MDAQSLAAAQASGLPPDTVSRLRHAAESFESQALGALFQPIFNTVDLSHSAVGGGVGEAQWQPMLVDAYAKATASGGGLGIADAVFRELLRAQSAASVPEAAASVPAAPAPLAAGHAAEAEPSAVNASGSRGEQDAWTVTDLRAVPARPAPPAEQNAAPTEE